MKVRKKNALFQLLCDNPEERIRIVKRFWNYVRNKAARDSKECWIWGGKIIADGGYGIFSHKNPETKIVLMAATHRLSLMIATGRDEVYLDACHTCDNPPCVRPDHLFWGTHTQNMRDKRDKARSRQRALTITEDIVVRARQSYESALDAGADRNSAIYAALKQGLSEIFKGDPDKTYREEIKKLQSEIDQLKTESLT